MQSDQNSFWGEVVLNSVIMASRDLNNILKIFIFKVYFRKMSEIWPRCPNLGHTILLKVWFIAGGVVIRVTLFYIFSSISAVYNCLNIPVFLSTRADTGFFQGGGAEFDASQKNLGFGHFAREAHEKFSAPPLAPLWKNAEGARVRFVFINSAFKVIFMYFKRVFRLLGNNIAK